MSLFLISYGFYKIFHPAYEPYIQILNSKHVAFDREQPANWSRWGIDLKVSHNLFNLPFFVKHL